MNADAIRTARQTLGSVVRRTPLDYSSTLSELSGGQVYLKCENLQRTGSFKIRGAFNRLAALSEEERRRGVVAASAGNHAQGVALAAQLLGISATIFMPESTPLAKIAATEGYGATIRLAGATYDEAFVAARREQAEHGATLIHAYDDELVVAGQGTIGLEIVEDLPAVDTVLVPVGGGGLIAGIATAVKAATPGVRMVGIEARSSGIADGIAVKQPGKLTLPIIRALVDGVVTVEDELIARAVVFLLERAKLAVEGAGAVGVASLLGNLVDLRGRTAAIVLSGGNIDINLMARIIEHGLATDGRYLIFETWLPDRPGELLKLLGTLRAERINILSIEHRRPKAFPDVEVMLTVETRDRQHRDHLLAQLGRAGYKTQRL